MKNKLKASIYIIFSSLVFICFIYSQAEEQPKTVAQPENKEEAKLLVDLEFKDADIKDIAKAFSRISGINIIVSDEVKAKVTLRVQAMDWRQALNMILGAYNLTTVEKQDYIVITTFERRRHAEESGDLQTRVFALNFVSVDELQKTLTSMLTSRGKIEIDTRTNSLVVTDIPERIDKIQDVALKLDTKTPQVMIEAIMLTVKLTDDDQMGVDWTVTHKERDERAINQTLNIEDTRIGYIKYGKTLLSWANLSAQIDFWIREKKAQILANPRVLTLDNLEATIDLVEQEPYTSSTTTDQGTVTSTQFKEVPIKLYVKPHITKDNYIFMNINTEQSYRTGYTTDNQPIIDSRKAATTVMVRDGETIAIGGLRKKEDSTTIDKFPILGDIPLLGKLFRRTVKAKVDTELIIFVVPHIATDMAFTKREVEQLEIADEMKTGEKKVSPLEKAVPFSLRPPKGAK